MAGYVIIQHIQSKGLRQWQVDSWQASLHLRPELSSKFAVTTNTEQHGFNIHTVGIILMIVGVVGAVISLIALLGSNVRRHRTVIDDGRGNVVTRQDSTI